MKMPTAFTLACPLCGGEAVAIVDVESVTRASINLSRPRLVLDTHVADNPDCPLAAVLEESPAGVRVGTE